MADSSEIPALLAGNPAAIRRYRRMVDAVGGVPEGDGTMDDLIAEALYGEDEDDDPTIPDFARRRYADEDLDLDEEGASASSFQPTEADPQGQRERRNPLGDRHRTGCRAG
jgi:hypothetical protein